MADPAQFPEEHPGIEGRRITYTRNGPGVALILTQDFHEFDRYGVIIQSEDKDAALLPRRSGGRWALIHRSVSAIAAHIWISYSTDLRECGSIMVMATASVRMLLPWLNEHS